LFAHIAEHKRQAFFEILKTEICVERHPLVLDPSPQYFYEVQLRGVGRQEENQDILLLPLLDFCLEFFGPMYRGIIEDNYGLFDGTGDEAVNKTGARFRFVRALAHLEKQLVFTGHQAHHVEAFPLRARQKYLFSLHLPGVGDIGGKPKMAFIPEI